MQSEKCPSFPRFCRKLVRLKNQQSKDKVRKHNNHTKKRRYLKRVSYIDICAPRVEQASFQRSGLEPIILPKQRVKSRLFSICSRFTGTTHVNIHYAISKVGLLRDFGWRRRGKEAPTRWATKPMEPKQDLSTPINFDHLHHMSGEENLWEA